MEKRRIIIILGLVGSILSLAGLLPFLVLWWFFALSLFGGVVNDFNIILLFLGMLGVVVSAILGIIGAVKVRKNTALGGKLMVISSSFYLLSMLLWVFLFRDYYDTVKAIISISPSPESSVIKILVIILIVIVSFILVLTAGLMALKLEQEPISTKKSK